VIGASRRVPWLALATGVLMVFLYAPLVIAVMYAFNGSSNLTWPPHGFSLQWFQRIFEDDLFRNAFVVSIQAAVLSSLISAALGMTAAFVFTRRRSRLSSLVEGAARLPVMLPPLFIGVGFVALMTLLNASPSLLTIVLGHTVISVPFVVTIVVARLRNFEPEIELAARDLGAGPWQALRRITLPILAPAIAGAVLLAFAFSFDEILVTNFTSGTLSTVPIYVLGRLRRYSDPGANAVATILLLIPWLTFGIGALFLRRTGGSIGELLGQRVR
jgi:spermidine/putrescine transport system permease protein